MELVKVGDKTYYIKKTTNIGIYKIDEENVYLIDSGNDHIGGNKVIQDRTNCSIYAYNIEKSITEYPVLEPSFLYGGYPFEEIRNKFLMSKESKVMQIDNNLLDGLEYIVLKGHFFDMIGIKTDDDVYFLANSLCLFHHIAKLQMIYLI